MTLAGPRPLDAVVVGSGPNGLAAAITLAAAGRSVAVLEAAAVPGGGVRSSELTLPGYVHDVCSAVHPLAIASPFFARWHEQLGARGLEWIFPPVSLAHPFDDGTAAVLMRSLADTLARLDARDRRPWQALFGEMIDHWSELLEEILAPPHFPRHPLMLLRFGSQAIRSSEAVLRSRFADPRSQGLFAGLAAHSFLPLQATASSAIALVLGAAAQVAGWPIPRGGSARIAAAMVSLLQSLGGELRLGVPIRSPRDLPPSRVVLWDLSISNLLRVAAAELPSRFSERLWKWRAGPGVFKLDWALSTPVPWLAPACRAAGTIHLGGDWRNIARSEMDAVRGAPPKEPFVLFAQPSVFDPSRAPEGRHTAWAYCHVPLGYRYDATAAIEAQVERFAPGFGETILARSIRKPADLERENANLVGGDISGGIPSLRQIIARPVLSRDPYRLPVPGWYLCSSSTPPGAGVHGMCGYHAACAALKRELAPAQSPSVSQPSESRVFRNSGS